jgi:hypothetical protein
MSKILIDFRGIKNTIHMYGKNNQAGWDSQYLNREEQKKSSHGVNCERIERKCYKNYAF